MQLAVVTDELSADPETAIELAGELSIGAIEIRGVGAERFPRVATYWLDRLPRIIDRAKVRVVSISSGLFKLPFAASTEPSWPDAGLRWRDTERHAAWRRDRAGIDDHSGALLGETIHWAGALGCSMISCFSFLRPSDARNAPCPPQVIDVLRAAAQKAAEAGVTLVLENEAVCWGDTGRNTAAIVRRVDHPNFALLWDPTNAYAAGEVPFPAGYDHVRGLVRHVHFKDARRTLAGEFEYVAAGDVDWERQIPALLRDGYDAYVTVETHATPKIASTRALIERLRKLINTTHDRTVAPAAEQGKRT